MGKFYEFYIKTMKSIGFTYRIPRYIMGRQNYIGFTYKSPITYLYLFTVFRLWRYELPSFQAEGTKLEQYLPKNQHTQMKLWNLRIGVVASCQKLGIIVLIK